MSINDPQWGNSHRPEQKEPEQVPESPGTEPVQPDAGHKETQSPKPLSPAPPSSPPSPQLPQSPRSPKSTPPEGPPDLEELWQQWVYQARCRIARLLRRELPAPPGPAAQVSASSVSSASVSPSLANDEVPLAGWQSLSLKSWLMGVSLIIGAWLVSGFYLVDSQQRGVLSRFGSIVAVEDPGWHWRWPYPIDSVRLINVTADRSLEVGFSAQKDRRQTQGLMLTADGNLINVAYAVLYQVTDPVDYLSRAETPTDLLALLAESVLRDVVAQQTLATVQAAGGPAKDTAMLQTARQQLQTALDPLQMGIVVKGVEIREVLLPAPVLQAIKDTERDAQARAKTLREAQTASTENLIKTRKLAGALQDETAAYAAALDHAAQTLRVDGAKGDAAEAQKALAVKAKQWQQQYPLVFSNLAALQGRIAQPATVRSTAPTNAAASAKNGDVKAPGAASGEWRDRDIMRSRDRVDRPGSGS